uniref:U4/U6.U5 tri-snRNP-associated protein 1 n=1 Tax=Panagrellus redivivus TaxID=6233 RepID=A0A7E4VPS9_PANRE
MFYGSCNGRCSHGGGRPMAGAAGKVQKKNVLAKYDEGVDGPVGRETFKLNSRGTLDIAREEEELRVKRKLHMANKQLQSLETPKYKIASEFYTEEEMISFRKPKKKKDKSSRKVRGSKSSALKADDLMPLEPEAETTEEKEAREAKLRARRRAVDKEVKEEDFKPIPEAVDAEDGEIIEPPKPEKTRFRNTMGATVDTSRLRSLASKLAAESESDDEDDFGPADNLAGVVIDDEVEDELASALDRARKERLAAQAAVLTDGATAVTELLSKIKKEEPADEDMDVDEEKGVVFDATAEYYKTIGSRPTYGLAGNREDEVDFSELHAEEARELAKKERRRKEREADAAEEERRRVKKEKKHLLAASSKKEKESSSKDDRDRHHRKRRHHDEEEDEDVDMEAAAEESGTKKGEHENVLGKERDVTKGVAGMLKLASEKGYLEDPNAKKNRGGTLKHLESKNFAKVEFMKHDIEDKYLKKMERVGTTGSGPIRPFVDKQDYNPQIEIVYTDAQGREMEPKAAFRDMSHKFHGKGSSKNQIEKRMRQQEKKEKMKKMNSFDTPLGTLSKQVKKQEQTGSHYIILSGNSRDTGAPLQKE